MLRRSLLPLLVCAVVLRGLTALAADPLAELGAFSVFPNADMGKLAKGDVLTARGPATSVGRHLSAQSCYIIPKPPAKALEALANWDPSKHRELKIYLHSELPLAPKPGDFAKLTSAPDNGSVRALVTATEKQGPDLQVSREESKKFTGGGGGKDGMPEGVRAFWTGVLADRAQSFAAGGAGKQPPYDHAAAGIQPADELNALLKPQEKIRRQFAAFLGESGLTGGKVSLKNELYFELIDVEDEGVLTLGSFASKPVGGGFQAADLLYYASGGYYVAATLYQMWPIDVGGQPSTLVWRADLISSASLASLHGVEKLASESAMMKDISKAVNLLKRDSVGR